MSLISRVTRASVLEVLNEDFVRTAKARGAAAAHPVAARAAQRRDSHRHRHRHRAGLPDQRVVITESVFNLPGLGRLTIDAVLSRDYPVVQGVIPLFACVTSW